MPSTPKAQKAILSLIPRIDGTIYELGSGWGNLAFALSRKHPESQVIGIENSWIPFIFSQSFAFFFSYPNLSLKRENFFDTPLNSASLVVCYLYPGAMEKLCEKFTRELRPGTYIISNTFALPNWRAQKVITLNDLYQTKIYLYRTDS